MSRGFLIFAHNNEQIDYCAIAIANALMIKSAMPGSQVCLITDQGSLDWMTSSRPEAAKQAFDHVVVNTSPLDYNAKKKCFDTLSTSYDLPWHNRSRSTAYDLSPFDETILLDADYLIQDATLNHAWGSSAPYRLNSRAVKVSQAPLHPDEVKLEDFGIDMFWATCVYFRKCEEAELLFSLVEHVRDNYLHYQNLYGFPGVLFRNDYAFSIALHILSNWQSGHVETLPCPYLLSSFDCDELIGVERGSLNFLINHEVERYRFTTARVKGVSTHVMNKFSVARHADKLIEIYGGAA